MDFSQFVRNQLKGPLALIAGIIMSFVAFLQFISLFVGRWIDFIEFGSVVLFVVMFWLIFAKATSNSRIEKKTVSSLLFAWTIVKMVSIGLGILMIFISSIYVMSEDAIGAGFIMLILGGGLYGGRLFIMIMFLMELMNFKKNTSPVYRFKNNWFVLGIIAAALRFAGMIVMIITSFSLIKSAYGYFDMDIFDYFKSSDFMLDTILGSLGLGSILTVSFIDLCYAGALVLILILAKKYSDTTKRIY